MEKPSIAIYQSPFPNQMASDEEKSTEEYGLRVAKSIEGEWFRRKGTSCRFYDQWGEYHRLRLYARGEQPMQKYKDELAINGDMSMLNLDWSPIPIIPKFVDIVVNGMTDRLYKVKDFLQQTKDEFGIDQFNMDPSELPSSDQELSLYMQINYKPGIEIAEEVAIDTIFKMNKFDEVKKEFDYDVTTIGIGVMKHEFLVNDGVNVEYVDPANWIHSYTEKEDFSDCYYFGEVKQVHYTELLKNSSSAWNNYFPIVRNYQEGAFLDEVVTLMYFNYKTSKRFVWKKKLLENGGERVIRKGDTFNPPTGDGIPFEIIEAPREVWYEGILVGGSNILLKWNLEKNMA